jgi:hypothetical protein
MIRDYLKAGYPALCLLTQEQHRAEQLLPSEGFPSRQRGEMKGKQQGPIQMRNHIRQIAAGCPACGKTNAYQ